MIETRTSTESIRTESEYRVALETLKRRRRPATILRLVMNTLERYRQSRKIGWSRPQNKNGLRVFRAFKLDISETQPLVRGIFRAVEAEFPELNAEHFDYLECLRQDPGLMFYIFVHDHTHLDSRYEGITFSFGRRTPRLPRHRDRFDLIVESPIRHGRSQGPARVRTYIDPFQRPIAQHPALELGHEPLRSTAVQRLFGVGVDLYASTPAHDARVWSHWTQEYIDYFGPRVVPVSGSFFPTQVDRSLVHPPLASPALL